MLLLRLNKLIVLMFQVQWFLNDTLLQPSNKVSIVEERGLIILHINNITDGDAGIVKCLVKNALAEIKSEVALEITGEQAAPKILDKSPSTAVNADESVELFAKVSGAPTPTGIFFTFKFHQINRYRNIA